MYAGPQSECPHCGCHNLLQRRRCRQCLLPINVQLTVDTIIALNCAMALPDAQAAFIPQWAPSKGARVMVEGW